MLRVIQQTNKLKVSQFIYDIKRFKPPPLQKQNKTKQTREYTQTILKLQGPSIKLKTHNLH